MDWDKRRELLRKLESAIIRLYTQSQGKFIKEDWIKLLRRDGKVQSHLQEHGLTDKEEMIDRLAMMVIDLWNDKNELIEFITKMVHRDDGGKMQYDHERAVWEWVYPVPIDETKPSQDAIVTPDAVVG